MDSVRITLAETPEERAACAAIRHEVFVLGQNLPADAEQDEHDRNPTTWHLLAYLNGQPAGTVRVFFPEPGKTKIGRLAVPPAFRKHGIGRMLMEQALEDLPGHGYGHVVISAQAYLQTFYEGLGFACVGEPFTEFDMPHLRMEMDLPAPARL